MPGPNVDMFIVIISSPRGARRWSADTSGLRARDNQPGPAYKIIQSQLQRHHRHLHNQLYRDALTARYCITSPHIHR